MRVHHIEFLCRDLNLQLQKFCYLYGFRVYGKWTDHFSQQKEKVVLRRDRIYFILHEDKEAECDSVDNITLETDKVAELCERIPAGYILVKPNLVMEDDENNIMSQCKAQSSVEGAVIRSPVGRLKHTLVNKTNYHGCFLPNFTCFCKPGPYDLCFENWPFKISESSFSQHHDEFEDFNDRSYRTMLVDHIAFAVNSGTSFELMRWYSEFLGMERCKVNNNEQPDGFKVETLNGDGKQLGLRLTAMKYHFCSEMTVEIPTPTNSQPENPKIVFAESLLGQGPNQVDTFLRENNGPGVQHIGVLSRDIFASVQQWSFNGVKFIKPPIHYYNEIDDKIKKLGKENLREMLEEHGVLLDFEEDEEGDTQKYLLQVFTKPIFSEDTFFFELIQRQGASGFGAGNISALWRAVDAYMKEGNKF